MSFTVRPVQNQGFSQPAEAPITRQSSISHHKLSKIISQHLNNKTPRTKSADIKIFKLRPMKLPNSGIHKRSKTRKRTKTPFSSNTTISRSIDKFHSHQFKNDIANVPELNARDDLFDRVEDHACRRLQVFYYQCVAYFNEKCTVSLSKTIHQNGFSSCNDCCAAHSSLLPALQDNIVLTIRESIIKDGLTDNLMEKLDCLGVSGEKLLFWKSFKNWNADKIIKEIPEEVWHSLLSQGCYVYEVMNSTVEVPSLVNIFDNCIEKLMRPIALDILNQVSKGLLNPYQGVQLLGAKLNDFFLKVESETLQKIDIFEKVKDLENQLLELETLSSDQNKMLPRREWSYLYLTKLNDIRRYKMQFDNLKDYSLNFKQDWNEYKPMAVLEAVCNFYKNEKDTIENINNVSMLEEYLKSRKEVFHSLISINENLHEMYDLFPHFSNFYKKKELLLQFIEECDPIDFALSQPGRVKQIFQWLVEAAFTHPMRTPYASKDKIDKLNESLLICRLQEQGSCCPSLDALSGGQTFESQKLELWKRNI